MSELTDPTVKREHARESAAGGNGWGSGEVTKVEGTTVTTDGSGVFGGWPEGTLPEVGDKVRYFNVQGSLVRGAEVNGVLRWWKTDAELEESRRTSSKNFRAKRFEEFEEQRDQLDADYEALPEPFQARITSLRLAGGDEWRAMNESYEMFVCTQAVAFADAFGTEEELKKFYDLPVKEQYEACPAMSHEHSGNTFGAAVSFAKYYVRGQHGPLAIMPSALSPLTGDPRYTHERDVREVEAQRDRAVAKCFAFDLGVTLVEGFLVGAEMKNRAREWLTEIRNWESEHPLSEFE